MMMCWRNRTPLSQDWSVEDEGSILLRKQATRKVITWVHGRGEGDGAWAVGRVNRKMAFSVPHGCFSSQEEKGIVRKGKPFSRP
jgi:hypothetical protein